MEDRVKHKSSVLRHFKAPPLIFFLMKFSLYSQELIEITSPVGGDFLYTGSDAIIKWEVGASVDSLDILLWDGNSASWTILAESYPAGSSSFTFNVNEYMITDKAIFYIFQSGKSFDCYTRNNAYLKITMPPEQTSPYLGVDSPVIDFDKILISPNPASDFIHINNDKSNIKNISIYNFNGLKIEYPDEKVCNKDKIMINISQYGILPC